VRPRQDCGNLTEDQPCGIIDIPAIRGTVSWRKRPPVRGDRSRFPALPRARRALSPLDGIGPESLSLDRLVRRVEETGVREVILATNPSMEGEVTATYIQQLLAGRDVRVTRLARGLPMGGDLEYVDGVTLAHALIAREEVG
jgi:hypothetical protein